LIRLVSAASMPQSGAAHLRPYACETCSSAAVRLNYTPLSSNLQ
jgi:hypothetical protein